MKFSTASAALVASTLVLPALATRAVDLQNETRDLSTATAEELELRDLFQTSDYLNERDLEEIDARDFEDLEDIEARELGALEELFTREELDALAELEAREPFWFLGKIAAKVARKAGGAIANHVNNRRHRKRDFEDLEDVEARELDDIEELLTREELDALAELEEREPFWFLGKIAAKVARKAGGAIANHVNNRRHRKRDFEDLEDVEARELDDVDELLTREELDALAELEAREPFWFLGKIAAKVARKAGGAIANHVNNRRHRKRDFSDFEDELLERDMDLDELD